MSAVPCLLREDPVPPVPAERRGAPRFLCEAAVFPSAISLVEPLLLCATVADVSLGGIGLVADMPLDPGQFLLVRLRTPSRHFSCDVRAQVRHLSPGRDQTWLLGCEFSRPLQSDELDALVEATGMAEPAVRAI